MACLPCAYIIFQFTPLREGRPGYSEAYSIAVNDFNSRPSARGDKTTAYTFAPDSIFQFTPLREGRRRLTPPPHLPRHFNSRPSARGDADPAAPKRKRGNFNSRPSARGDPPKCFQSHPPPFQFTPLREGRH